MAGVFASPKTSHLNLCYNDTIIEPCDAYFSGRLTTSKIKYPFVDSVVPNLHN